VSKIANNAETPVDVLAMLPTDAEESVVITAREKLAARDGYA